jgi:hypothetical protein
MMAEMPMDRRSPYPRVFCIKRMSLSIDRRSPKTSVKKTILQIVPVTASIESAGSF